MAKKPKPAKSKPKGPAEAAVVERLDGEVPADLLAAAKRVDELERQKNDAAENAKAAKAAFGEALANLRQRIREHSEPNLFNGQKVAG